MIEDVETNKASYVNEVRFNRTYGVTGGISSALTEFESKGRVSRSREPRDDWGVWRCSWSLCLLTRYVF